MLTIPAWLDAVKSGRCQATNGPLLTLKVDGRTLGETIDLKEPGSLKIEASALGRAPLEPAADGLRVSDACADSDLVNHRHPEAPSLSPRTLMRVTAASPDSRLLHDPTSM